MIEKLPEKTKASTGVEIGERVVSLARDLQKLRKVEKLLKVLKARKRKVKIHTLDKFFSID